MVAFSSFCSSLSSALSSCCSLFDDDAPMMEMKRYESCICDTTSTEIYEKKG